ncbi:MAG: hypothetical protein H6721_10595 [Sandaracinus sp.]|nr:hypothetical protein [Sandaracinus sp.]MCB9614882.1 hypothetical protein [Sandaracinus sp.]MCB9618634.1 hypothetical protein [Sandaracinus sp.]MCB9632567.1 hypothetical protein [Sandaracinus sp.]
MRRSFRRYGASAPLVMVALCALLLGVSGVWLETATAQAPEHPDGHVHDWLVWWPRCAQERFAPERIGRSELLYPRPGFPAVARPGDRLTTRVRLVAPLTPPPGVQQEKALRGWAAELEGRPTWRVEGAEHRYPLRVADVRPDTRQSTVFRASVDLPPWMAPGTYDLVIRVPGGETLAGVASVRVVVGEPRLAALPSNVSPRELAPLDVDVWVASEVPDALRRPLAGEGLPWLDPEVGAVLAVGDAAVWDGTRCDDLLQPRAAADRLLGARRPTSVEPFEGRVEVEGGTARVFGPATLRYLVPEGREVRAEGATVVGAWPATPVRPSGLRPSVVVALRADSGAVVPEVVASGALEVRLRTPERFSSGGVGEVALEGAPEGTALALAWEEDGSAFGTGPLEVGLRWMESSELQGLALAPNGRSRRLAATVVGVPRRPSGCATSGPETSGNWWLAVWLCTIGGARYTSARSRRARAAPKSERREQRRPDPSFRRRP